MCQIATAMNLVRYPVLAAVPRLFFCQTEKSESCWASTFQACSIFVFLRKEGQTACRRPFLSFLCIGSPLTHSLLDCVNRGAPTQLLSQPLGWGCLTLFQMLPGRATFPFCCCPATIPACCFPSEQPLRIHPGHHKQRKIKQNIKILSNILQISLAKMFGTGQTSLAILTQVSLIKSTLSQVFLDQGHFVPSVS